MGQGNNGGSSAGGLYSSAGGGGGGGATTVGDSTPSGLPYTDDGSGANGGEGLAVSITGTNNVYGSGGGGGWRGGTGGTGGTNAGDGGVNATANYGGGGGGGYAHEGGNGSGGYGGSGIVIIKYSGIYVYQDFTFSDTEYYKLYYSLSCIDDTHRKRISSAQIPLITTGQGGLSITFFLKITQLKALPAEDYIFSTVNKEIYIKRNVNKFEWSFDNGANISYVDNTYETSTTFKHYAFTNDGSLTSFFIDGVAQTVINNITTLPLTTEIIEIGEFIGYLQDLRIFDRALSENEINDILYYYGQGSLNVYTLIKPYTNYEIDSKFTNYYTGSEIDKIIADNVSGNLELGDFLFMNGKEAFRATDTWLRLNQSGDFTSGIYVKNVLRVDGGLNIGGGNYLSYPTGDYGSIQINNNGKGNWEGYSIDGRVVFMHNTAATNWGIYDDTNNWWMIYGILGTYVELRYANATKLQTTNTGVSITGNLTVSGTLSGTFPINYALFNNMGNPTATYSDFNLIPNFGNWFINGTGNAPTFNNTATSFYSWNIGMGSEYEWTASDSYGAQFALPRNIDFPYLSVRFKENNVWIPWRKISAQYADVAGSASSSSGNFTVGDSIFMNNSLTFDKDDNWARIYGGTNGVAIYRGISMNDQGYLNIGEWQRIPDNCIKCYLLNIDIITFPKASAGNIDAQRWKIYQNNATSEPYISQYGGTSSSEDLIFQYASLDNTGEQWLRANDSGNDDLDFTGSHRCIAETSNLLDEVTSNIEYYQGLLVSTTGYYQDINKTDIDFSSNIRIDSSLPIIKLTEYEKDKSVYGVISNVEDGDKRIYKTGNWHYAYKKTDGNRIMINAVGEGAIYVCNYPDIQIIENGDYLHSSPIKGYAMKQDDDLLHNYTVAKTSCSVDFINSESPFYYKNFKHRYEAYNDKEYICVFIGCSYHCS